MELYKINSNIKPGEYYTYYRVKSALEICINEKPIFIRDFRVGSKNIVSFELTERLLYAYRIEKYKAEFYGHDLECFKIQIKS